MSLELRDYQEIILDKARSLVKLKRGAILIQSPTGSGKTVMVATMMRTASERGYGAWFNVHRRELVKQSVSTLTEAAGLEIGVVAAGFPGNRRLPLQVCSIGTLKGRRHLLPNPRLIIWDEAHHTPAASWAEIFAAYPNALHIGLTATPERLDGTGLGKYFGDLIVGPSVRELIDAGWLCDFKLYAPGDLDLSAVHTTAGDFNKKELAVAMKGSTVTGDVISEYRQRAAGLRMVLFAWSIEASIDIAAKFNACGIPAMHVDGTTHASDRDSAMAAFKDGSVRVLTNVDLFSEGVDVPAIEAVAMLRPTKSLAMFLQQIGRGLRPAPGKEYCVILDHAGNCRRFGLPDDPRDWTLEGRKREKKKDDAPPIKQCRKCYAVVSMSADSCKYCGYKFVTAPREVELIEGSLQEVKTLTRDERMRQQSEAKSLEDLIKIGRLRGYKKPEAWAEHLYKARLAKSMAVEAANFLKG